MTIKILHKTPSATIEIELQSALVPSNDLINYENKTYFKSLCETGCPNYNKKWSCPPHSPSYLTYAKQFNYCVLLLMTCDLSQFRYVKTEYMKVKTSNSILKSQSDKLARFLESTIPCRMLSNGSCKLCKPCTKKNSDDRCKNPSSLRYSLEALGLNVEQISIDIFNHKLKWYRNKTAPPYSSVIFAVLLSNAIPLDALTQLLECFYVVGKQKCPKVH